MGRFPRGTPVRSVEPFLKWAGGKRWLALNYLHKFPARYNRYIEPFLGSGAVFFALSPSRAIISDVNSDLIDTYRSLADDWFSVLLHLQKHNEKHSPNHYYRVRATLPSNPAESAARLIYLNRTCWNGLYRVNKQGMFNVPIGTKSAVLLATDDFKAVAQRLKCAKIINSDFASTIALAKKGDLIFADPPYTVTHNSNNFIKYNETLFTWDDQLRLRDALVSARARGAFVVATNANHEDVAALYDSNFSLEPLPRHSVLAANSEKRRPVTELLIRTNHG